MKQKDINTVIREGISKGDGLAYKDEYWNEMDDLLNKNIPVTNSQPAITKVAKISKGLQFKAILSIATSIVVVTYYTLFSDLNSSPQPNIHQQDNQTRPVQEQTIIKDNNTSLPNHSADQPQRSETNLHNPLLYNSSNETENHEQINTQNTDASANNTSNTIDGIEQKSTPHSIELNENKNINIGNNESENHNENKLFPVVNEEPLSVNTNNAVNEIYNTESVVTKTIDFNLIPPAENFSDNIKIQYDQALLPKYPNKNRLIQHASVSPFIGVNYVSKNKTYTSDKILYTNPKQDHIIYGLNLQLESKYFAIRTGLGISTAQLNSSFQSIETNYSYDTSYIIVDPNYQTTPSGNPIALIRQQIDSSLLSSQTRIHQGSAEYKYLVIPLTIQYRFAHRKYSFFVEGGSLNNFIISTKTDNSFPQEFSEKQASIPKYTLQFTAGTGIGYALNSKYTLEAQYNYALGKSSPSINWLNNSHIFTIMLTRNLW
jgi:opacity protein-like surface antigen